MHRHHHLTFATLMFMMIKTAAAVGQPFTKRRAFHQCSPIPASALLINSHQVADWKYYVSAGRYTSVAGAAECESRRSMSAFGVRADIATRWRYFRF
jgi:hypothetical protein